MSKDKLTADCQSRVAAVRAAAPALLAAVEAAAAGQAGHRVLLARLRWAYATARGVRHRALLAALLCAVATGAELPGVAGR